MTKSEYTIGGLIITMVILLVLNLAITIKKFNPKKAIYEVLDVKDFISETIKEHKEDKKWHKNINMVIWLE